MDLGISGKTALVTGGGRGLGLAVANALAAEGVKVAVASRTRADVESFADEAGEGHIGIAVDLLARDGPSEMISRLTEAFGLPDIVVHNAGGTLDIKDPMCPMEDWRRVFRFNLEVAVELNQVFLPHLQAQGWGRVLHISSISSLENQGPVPYCSAKAALNAYVRSMGRIVSSDGVMMAALLPGAVFTEGGYWDYTSRDNPEHVEKYLQERMAIQRFGRLDEIGPLATFLCSQHASFIVGSAITVDGGQGRCFFGDGT
jgi:3-oxoacyl-[acyl-carrier protein] reductase